MLKLYKNKVTIISLLFFVFVILDCRKDTRVEDFTKLKSLNPYLISNEKCIFTNTSDAKRLKAIENAILILKETNPTIADWVEEKQKNEQLIFTNDDAGYYAKFDFINGNLYINRSIFVENDGVIAVTFAHEYRHSRQSYTKFIKSVISRILSKIGNDEILENDAVAYEQKAYNAIFNYYDE